MHRDVSKSEAAVPGLINEEKKHSLFIQDICCNKFFKLLKALKQLDKFMYIQKFISFQNC